MHISDSVVGIRRVLSNILRVMIIHLSVYHTFTALQACKIIILISSTKFSSMNYKATEFP
jgi:hypothetical protein